MEGMSIKDIQPIRLQFSDHPSALARGDIDAYVGAEPAPGISLANGTGRLVEYPYSTPIGSLNMILSASEKAVKENPQRIKMVVDMHRKAVDHAMANPPQIVDVAMQKLGQQKKSIEFAVPNVELAWKLDDVFMQRANAYTRLMFENKQIRQMPDLDRHITKQFMYAWRTRDRLERASHHARASAATIHPPETPATVRRAGASWKNPQPRARRGFSPAADAGVGPRGRHHRHAARPEPARSRRDDVRLLVRRHL